MWTAQVVCAHHLTCYLLQIITLKHQDAKLKRENLGEKQQ